MKKTIIIILSLMMLLVGCGFVKSEDEIVADVNKNCETCILSVEIENYNIDGNRAIAHVKAQVSVYDFLTNSNKTVEEEHVVRYEKDNGWNFSSFE